jgi:hypothetical protein
MTSSMATAPASRRLGGTGHRCRVRTRRVEATGRPSPPGCYWGSMAAAAVHPRPVAPRVAGGCPGATAPRLLAWRLPGRCARGRGGRSRQARRGVPPHGSSRGTKRRCGPDARVSHAPGAWACSPSGPPSTAPPATATRGGVAGLPTQRLGRGPRALARPPEPPGEGARWRPWSAGGWRACAAPAPKPGRLGGAREAPLGRRIPARVFPVRRGPRTSPPGGRRPAPGTSPHAAGRGAPRPHHVVGRSPASGRREAGRNAPKGGGEPGARPWGVARQRPGWRAGRPRQGGQRCPPVVWSVPTAHRARASGAGPGVRRGVPRTGRGGRSRWGGPWPLTSACCPPRGGGARRQWRPGTPTLAAGLTAQVWTPHALRSYRVSAACLEQWHTLEPLLPRWDELHHGS